MPLEISEIGVRLSVGEAPPRPGPAASPGLPRTGTARPLSQDEMDVIVQTCVMEAVRLIRMTETR